MEPMEKLRMLQAIYAGAIADHVLRLGDEGVLDKVENKKRVEQMKYGKIRAAQMGITSSEEVFTKLSDIMGCADWKITPKEDGTGFTATALRCMLCTFAKKMGTKSPCHIYCLDPMEGMIKGLEENALFEASSTLFDGSQCSVSVTKKQRINQW